MNGVTSVHPKGCTPFWWTNEKPKRAAISARNAPSEQFHVQGAMCQPVTAQLNTRYPFNRASYGFSLGRRRGDVSCWISQPNLRSMSAGDVKRKIVSGGSGTTPGKGRWTATILSLVSTHVDYAHTVAEMVAATPTTSPVPGSGFRMPSSEVTRLQSRLLNLLHFPALTAGPDD